MNTSNFKWMALAVAAIIFAQCADDDDDDDDAGDTSTTELPAIFGKFGHDVVATLSEDGSTVTLSASGTPDHKSAYYETTHSLYEAYSTNDFKQNPNKITSLNFTMTVPVNPTEAATKEATPMGPMGMAINGVPFYNQNAAPGDDIFDEIETFDQYEGHPTGTGSYHYHIEPIYITATAGSDAFMGMLADGFPVYGPVEDGNAIATSDLDDYHGHFGVTADYPNGIYHYHITDDFPWINGDGYYGMAGSITQ